MRVVDGGREPLETVELDVPRGDVWCWPFEIVVGAFVDAVVADVDGIEDEACSAFRTRASVGGVRELFCRDAGVVEAVPEGRRWESEADLSDSRIVCVEDGDAVLRYLPEGLLDLFCNRLELTVAVELVPKKVEDEGGFGFDFSDGLGEARFVDLKHAPIRFQGSACSRF